MTTNPTSPSEFDWQAFSRGSSGRWLVHPQFTGRPLLLFRPWPRDTRYGVFLALEEGWLRAGWYEGGPELETATFNGEWSTECTYDEGYDLLRKRTKQRHF